jgi:hypothetical protein
MKADLFHVAVLYAMGALASSLLGQKPSNLDLDRLSPSQLVKFVTYQNRSDVFDPTLNCVATSPTGKRDQDAIKRLVSLGEPSVPALEAEFAAVAKKGENRQFTPNIQELFYAYARIRGSRGYPRLRDMELSPKFSFAPVPLDGAIAVALGLTSYLSAAHPSLRVLSHCNGPQPRETLDQMIVAWQAGDRMWFETSLGETAARAIAVKDDAEFQAFRKTLWRDAPNAAVGYKFPAPAFLPKEQEEVDRDTNFYDRNGKNCGHMTIQFIHGTGATPPGYLLYAVDNPNIAEVLQLISTCARQ